MLAATRNPSHEQTRRLLFRTPPTGSLLLAFWNGGGMRFLLLAFGVAALFLVVGPVPARAQTARSQQPTNPCGTPEGADWNQVFAACDAFIKSSAGTPQVRSNAYLYRGLAWEAKGWSAATAQAQADWAQAIADYTEAIKLDPRNATAYLDRGASWQKRHGALAMINTFDLDDFNHAIEDLTAAVGIDPKLALAYVNRGDTWMDKYLRGSPARQPTDLNNSIADYTAAIGINPLPQSIDSSKSTVTDVSILNAYADRAEAYDLRKDSRANSDIDGTMADLGLAIADYTDAMRIEPQSKAYYSKRADDYEAHAQLFDGKNDLIHAIAGYNSAIADYKTAASLNPNDKTLQQPFALEVANVNSRLQKDETAVKFAGKVDLSHLGVINSIVYSKDGTRVLSGSDDKTLKLWDAATGTLLRTFSGHTDAVKSVALSPDGNQVLSGSADKSIKLWDTATGAILRTFTGHTASVDAVAFSPAGSRIASVSVGDRTVKLWDPTTGALLRSFVVGAINYTELVATVAFSPNGANVLATNADGNAELWDVATGELVRSFAVPGGDVFAASFSSDGSQVLTADVESNASSWKIRVWNAATGAVLLSFDCGKSCSPVAFSPDGARVFTGGGFPNVQVWDAKTGASVRSFSLPFNIEPPSALASSPDGMRVVWGRSPILYDLFMKAGVDDSAGIIQLGLSDPHSIGGQLDVWDVASGKLALSLIEVYMFSTNQADKGKLLSVTSGSSALK
jgi:WD40 repeat protein